MKKSLLFIFGALLLISFESNAQFYVGASGGNSFINHNLGNISGQDFKVNDNTGSWKVYGGLGNKFLGVEGGYRSVGSAQSMINGSLMETNITGWDVALKGTIHIGPFFGFAKAGAFFGQYDNTGEVASLVGVDKSTDFMWAVGVGVEVAQRLQFRLEWESLNLSDNNNISTLSLGTAIILGGGKDKGKN
ncbi:outer membrane protein [Flammeovirga kamogawensis]|uniref:Porin family protein n=1 Tax=Flammeovirga kamogawensis TaxID=373891 RepID=A0ABX8H0U1_9BACT|nr:porin family protein [Flammeovirga kamogawensis]MBB6462398.1 hypothetical protein [Flammeovirga kamogawensis]QWG09511.1 porin family protein [Flammeovirga kamogawensis]TRX65027.1 porin family protein [Flammeovirga kamogawensis]